jgi:hypothetical protein
MGHFAFDAVVIGEAGCAQNQSSAQMWRSVTSIQAMHE